MAAPEEASRDQTEDKPLRQALLERGTMGRERTLLWLAILVVTVLGLARRTPGLGDWSLFRDDAWQAMATRVDSIGELFTIGGTAPGYAMFLHVWGDVFGTSSSSLIAPAMIAGTILIPAVAIVSRRFGTSVPGAVFAAALVASSVVAIQFSARVKPFVPEALGASILLFVALRASRHPSARLMITYGFLAAASLVFSSSTLMVSATGLGVVAVATARRRPQSQTLVIAVTLGLILFSAAWYASVIAPAVTDVLNEWWEGVFLSPAVHGWFTAFSERVLGLLEGLLPGTSLFPSGIVVAIVAICLVVGVVQLARHREWSELAILIGPFVLAFVLSLITVTPFGGGRTDLVLYPSLAITAALGFEAVATWLAGSGRETVQIFLASVVGGSLIVASGPALYPQDDGRGLTERVIELAREDDLIVTLPESSYLWAWYTPGEVDVVRDRHSMTGFSPVSSTERVVYLPGFEVARDGPASSAARSASVAKVADVLNSQSPDGVWFVMATRFRGDVMPELAEVLRSRGYRASNGIERGSSYAALWVR